jgi:hypothetical protein
MTVEEFIEILKEFPREAEVVFTGAYGAWEHDGVIVSMSHDTGLKEYFDQSKIVEIKTGIQTG